MLHTGLPKTRRSVDTLTLLRPAEHTTITIAFAIKFTFPPLSHGAIVTVAQSYIINGGWDGRTIRVQGLNLNPDSNHVTVGIPARKTVVHVWIFFCDLTL